MMMRLHQRAWLILLLKVLWCGHGSAENYENLIIRVDVPGTTNRDEALFLSHLTRDTHNFARDYNGNLPRRVSMIVSDRPQLFDVFRVKEAENNYVQSEYLVDNYYFLTSKYENKKLTMRRKRLRDSTFKDQNELQFRSILHENQLFMHSFDSTPINYRNLAVSIDDAVYGFHEAKESNEENLRHLISVSSLEENWHKYLKLGPAPKYLIGFTADLDEATRFHLMTLYEHVHLVTFRGLETTINDLVLKSDSQKTVVGPNSKEAALDTHLLGTPNPSN